MNEISLETLGNRAVRLTHATPQFQRIADQLVRNVRRAMAVPDQAEPEVEQEFAALRTTLDDQFLPEFSKMYAQLLVQYLGTATGVILNGLESEPAQAYLKVAERIEADINASLLAYVERIGAALSPSSAR